MTNESINTPIIIYGCGGLGLEIVSYLRDLKAADGMIIDNLSVSFLDDNGGRADDIAKVIGGEVTVYSKLTEIDFPARFIVAVGDPIVRQRLYEDCVEAGLLPFTVIHPLARVDSTAVIGAGTVIAPFSFVGPFASLGANVVLNVHSTIGHDAQVGRSSVLCPYSALNGSAVCGEFSFLGTRATILPGKELGKYSKISSGSVLASNTPDGVLVNGNPAIHRVLFRDPYSG
jgi:sugar O-acyltransferase (sialic acid O-acetyltransferase NeuD family)